MELSFRSVISLLKSKATIAMLEELVVSGRSRVGDTCLGIITVKFDVIDVCVLSSNMPLRESIKCLLYQLYFGGFNLAR